MSKTNETVDHSKTVKGWAHQNSATGAYVFSAAQFNLVACIPATLVFTHEKLYTEAEVVAMLEAERLRVEAMLEKVDEFLRFLHDENMVELHDREPLMYALDQYRKNR